MGFGDFRVFLLKIDLFLIWPTLLIWALHSKGLHSLHKGMCFIDRLGVPFILDVKFGGCHGNCFPIMGRLAEIGSD